MLFFIVPLQRAFEETTLHEKKVKLNNCANGPKLLNITYGNYMSEKFLLEHSITGM